MKEKRGKNGPRDENTNVKYRNPETEFEFIRHGPLYLKKALKWQRNPLAFELLRGGPESP